jgi:hypothetical protein
MSNGIEEADNNRKRERKREKVVKNISWVNVIQNQEFLYKKAFFKERDKKVKVKRSQDGEDVNSRFIHGSLFCILCLKKVLDFNDSNLK